MSLHQINPWLGEPPIGWMSHVETSLQEDIGPGDATNRLLRNDLTCEWRMEVQQSGVLCGLGILQYLFDPEPENEEDFLNLNAQDGTHVRQGDIVAYGKLNAKTLLTRERTCLNYLMRLSGVSTLTSKFVHQVGAHGCKIIDTRKTTPGLRLLEKYAVRCGGGSNHRIGLFDGILIKDNHIAAVGSITSAVQSARLSGNYLLKLEVECETEEQVEEAIQAGADIVLLDNMSPNTTAKIVEKHKGKTLFEASGSMNLTTVEEYAKTGVDFISVGSITHSAPSLAIHMEVELIP